MRCSWVNLNNPLYVKYHDEEWGIPSYNDEYLFEILILEMMQTGLSWEIVLQKRENYRQAFDNFDILKIAQYDDEKIKELYYNKGLIRHLGKIKAIVHNAQIFLSIQKEYQTFANYIWSFSNKKIIYHVYQTTNCLSDIISKDLKKRGMMFVGSKVIYAYLQAIGIINDHEEKCLKYIP